MNYFEISYLCPVTANNPMKKIRTIIFDLGGVLINYSIEATVRKFEQIGCMNAAEFINPYKQSGVLLQLERGEIRPEDFHDAIIREIGCL